MRDDRCPPVAGTRLVVQTGATRGDILEDDRWASPVGDEIRGALSTLVTRELNAVDVHGVLHDDSLLVYRIAVDVQSFESWPGSHVLIDAVWSMRPARGQQTLTCRSMIRESATKGNDALVDGHRRQVTGSPRYLQAPRAAKRGSNMRTGIACPAPGQLRKRPRRPTTWLGVRRPAPASPRRVIAPCRQARRWAADGQRSSRLPHA